MLKLWLDDVRQAPDNSWARTYGVEDTIDFLKQCKNHGEYIHIASLDHDLNGTAYNYCQKCRDLVGQDKKAWYEIYVHGCEHIKTGRAVIEWMKESSLWPRTIIIHSHNSEGALRMGLIAHTYTKVILKPYSLEETKGLQISQMTKTEIEKELNIEDIDELMKKWNIK